MAMAILALASAGEAVPDTLIRLLMGGALSGGEHRLSRAIEMAERVLRGNGEAAEEGDVG